MQDDITRNTTPFARAYHNYLCANKILVWHLFSEVDKFSNSPNQVVLRTEKNLNSNYPRDKKVYKTILLLTGFIKELDLKKLDKFICRKQLH